MKNSKDMLKSIGTNLTLGTVVSSILLQSCIAFDSDAYNNSDNIYGNVTLTPETKANLLDVNKLNLSSKMDKYVNIIKIVYSDISSNYEKAVEFCNDPNVYVKNHFPDLYDSSFSIELSAKEKRIIIAMTDEQIRTSIKEHKFREFLQIGVQKGYFASAEEVLIVNMDEVRQFFSSNEDFEKYKNIIQKINSTSIHTKSGIDIDTEADFAVGAPVAAVGFAVVEIGAVIHMGIYTELWGKSDESPTKASQNEPVMNLWYLENASSANDKVIFYDELINNRIEAAMDFICETFPNINRDELYNYIVTLFKQYYNYE